jgi:hypothetical protein
MILERFLRKQTDSLNSACKSSVIKFAYLRVISSVP